MLWHESLRIVGLIFDHIPIEVFTTGALVDLLDSPYGAALLH